MTRVQNLLVWGKMGEKMGILHAEIFSMLSKVKNAQRFFQLHAFSQF